MDRDDLALRRRVAETVASDASEESSDEEEQTHVVREGAVRSTDADELELRDDPALAGDRTARRLDADIMGSGIDPRLERPPDLSEAVQVTDVAPDGSSIGRAGLTSPTGDAMGSSSVADEVVGRGAALGGDELGGSRLDPLGMLDSSDVGSPTDREIEQAIRRADGSMVSAAPIDPATGFPTGRDRDLDPPAPPTGRHDDPSYGGEHEHAPGMTGRDQDPTDDEQGDDIVGPGYAQPAPDSDYDVVTGANAEAALRTQGIAPYAQPTQDDVSSGAVSTVDLDLAAPGDDPRLTQYGPDGPQAVPSDATVAPPTDLIFDPPPEGASAAMADPGAALGGASMIGSSTPDEAPPPPDPPPGDDPDQGPLGPPGGDGGDS